MVLSISFGVRSVFGVMLDPISDQYGWPREIFSLSLAIQNMVWGLGQPIFGWIADRFGDDGWLVQISGRVLPETGPDVDPETGEKLAVRRLHAVFDAHPRVEDALARFLEAGHGVVFVTGNHDAELAFPEVRHFIASLCGLMNDDFSLDAFFANFGRYQNRLDSAHSDLELRTKTENSFVHSDSCQSITSSITK